MKKFTLKIITAYFIFISFMTQCYASTDSIDASLKNLINEYNIPGAVLAYGFKNEKIHIISAGYRDLKNKVPMSSKTVFLIGSISKSFTASLILNLVKENKISLKETLKKISTLHKGKLKKLVNLYPALKDITVQELLNHTSGVPEAINSKKFEEMFIKNPKQEWIDMNLLNSCLKQPFYFKAGDKGKWSYTNTDYILLGVILEDVTNKSAQDSFKTLWESLQFKDIYYPNKGILSSQANEHLATGYLPNDFPSSLMKAFKNDPVVEIPGKNSVKAYEIHNAYNIFSPTASGVAANAVTLSQWYRSLFEEYKFGVDFTKSMLDGVKNGPYNEAKYALGVTTHNSTEYGYIVSHDGLMPGYSSIVMYFKKYDLVLTLETNSSNNMLSTFNIYNGKIEPGLITKLLPLILAHKE